MRYYLSVVFLSCVAALGAAPQISFPAIETTTDDKSATSKPTRSTAKKISIGGFIPLTYNSATSQTTLTDAKTGIGIAANLDTVVKGYDMSFMLSASRTQQFYMRPDGANNANLCQEKFFPQIFAVPGTCGQYQVRAQALAWFHNFGAGLALVYNYLTDFSFKGSEVYNSKWSYGAAGILAGYRWQFGRIRFVALANFDYQLWYATAMQPNPQLSAWQIGGSFYVLYAAF